MFGLMKWAAPVAAMGLMLGIAGTRAMAEDAAEKKATGTVAGIVKDKDGNVAAGVQVKLFKPYDRGTRKAEKQSRRAEKGIDKVQKLSKAEKLADGDKPAKPEPISTTMTDNAGKYELKDIPVGKYTVSANIKGVGGARAPVEVKAGETATVDLKIEERKAGSHEKPADTEKKPEPAADQK